MLLCSNGLSVFCSLIYRIFFIHPGDKFMVGYRYPGRTCDMSLTKWASCHHPQVLSVSSNQPLTQSHGSPRTVSSERRRGWRQRWALCRVWRSMRTAWGPGISVGVSFQNLVNTWEKVHVYKSLLVWLEVRILSHHCLGWPAYFGLSRMVGKSYALRHPQWEGDYSPYCCL